MDGRALTGATEEFEAVKAVLERLSFLELIPARMRGYASRSVERMADDGSQLAAALFHLAEDPEQKQDLVDWLSELCAPQIVDLEFVEVEKLQDVTFLLQEEGGASISARSLSDGTLRFLGLLVALKTAKPGEILVIEEPETGLHPARAALLIQLLASIAESRACQIIATTHSPQVLLAVQNESPEALGRVIVFGRTPDAAGTLIRRLGTLPHFNEVAARRGVDYLFTTEWLEHSL